LFVHRVRHRGRFGFGIRFNPVADVYISHRIFMFMRGFRGARDRANASGRALTRRR